MLALEAADLSELGVDLATLGFEAAEIDALLNAAAADPREEATPEPPAVPVSQPGDLWLLGRHRLLCGSATDPADVARLLGGVRPHLMATDPPYGVSYDPAWRNRAGRLGDQAHRQGPERRPGRLARGLGAVSRRGRLRLARGAARHHRRRQPRRLRLRDPQPDHLGQGAAGALAAATTTGGTSPAGTRCATRARRTGTATASRRRSGDPEPRPGRHHGARHPEAGRGDAPADAEQQRARASRSTSPSPDRGPRSSPPRPAAGSASRWSSTRPTSMSRSTRWQAFTGETATLDGDGRSFAEIAAERSAP